jgi:DNA-binding beta-propeller fold protein YncE
VVANAESGHLRVFDVAGRREAAAVLLTYGAAGTPGAAGAAPAPAETGAPLGLAVSSDSRWLFASDGENPYVAVVDLPARRVVAYFPTGSGPDGVGYSPLVVM